MDWLDDIFKRYDLIFWIIIGVGTAVASALKKKKSDASGQAARRKQAAERAARDAAARAPRPAATAATPAPTRPRNPLEQAMAEFERLFGLEEEEAAGGARTRAPASRRPVSRAAPPAAPATAAAEPLSGMEVSMPGLSTPLAELPAFPGGELPAFERSEIGRALDTGLGALQTTGLDVLVGDTVVHGRREAWRPTGSWRDAVILREILGAPRAFAQNDIPGLQGVKG